MRFCWVKGRSRVQCFTVHGLSSCLIACTLAQSARAARLFVSSGLVHVHAAACPSVPVCPAALSACADTRPCPAGQSPMKAAQG
jgi:hypothetical protein